MTEPNNYVQMLNSESRTTFSHKMFLHLQNNEIAGRNNTATSKRAIQFLKWNRKKTDKVMYLASNMAQRYKSHHHPFHGFEYIKEEREEIVLLLEEKVQYNFKQME
jgi:hypothetical protein